MRPVCQASKFCKHWKKDSHTPFFFPQPYSSLGSILEFSFSNLKFVPSFCSQPERTSVLLLPTSTWVKRFNQAPCFGTTLDGGRGAHTSHCSIRSSGKPGYKMRVLAATHLIPSQFQEKEKEEGQEHLTTFSISFETVYALLHSNTGLFCPFRTVTSLNCFV